MILGFFGASEDTQSHPVSSKHLDEILEQKNPHSIPQTSHGQTNKLFCSFDKKG